MPAFDTSQSKGPIFIVGSPRSGTSILTWCLGQHANLLPQEESGWLGDFSISVGVMHRIGSLHGERSQLSALGIGCADFFKAMGHGIDELILNHRSQLEQKSRRTAEREPAKVHPSIKISGSSTDPKSRWVDGTPEYSLHICGLKKLFPDAKFVHIVRDVRSVVDSLMNFKPDGINTLVKTEQEAYEYWLRTEQACMKAELALGKQAMYRLRYDDLVHQPTEAIGGVLEFLGEAFTPACIEPLVRRINSSNVPIGFSASQQDTDLEVIERALQLSQQLQQPFTPCPASTPAMAELEAAFDKKVAFAEGLAGEYGLLHVSVNELSRRLNWCGAVFGINTAAAFLVTGDFIFIKKTYPGSGHLLWLSFATASAIIYATMRRKGLRKLAAEVARIIAPNKIRLRNEIMK